MSKVLKVCIRPDPELPDARQGWVMAPNEATALRIVDTEHALLFLSNCLWLGGPVTSDRAVSWSN